MLPLVPGSGGNQTFKLVEHVAPSSRGDVASKLLAWVLGGVGTLLVYSAYKSQNPLNILKGIKTTPIYDPTNPVRSQPIPEVPGSDPGGIVRLRMLANREIRPELVNIPGGGQLDKQAAESLLRINQRLGYTVQNVGAYRSYAVQLAAWAKDKNRFAHPSKSLHVVGIAIDVHAAQKSNQDLVTAFTAEGWHRARWGPGTSNDEEWHWSYGVIG
jgi:hypothetical protein